MADGLHLNRDELVSLTSTVQPKRMCVWLTERHWVFEPPARRGDIPKVARAYHAARMSGQALPTAAGHQKRPRARLNFMLQPS